MTTISQSAVVPPAVDWALAPLHAWWWAMDEGGEAFWYCAPQLAPLTGFWFCDQLPAPDFGYSGDWQASLTQRPSCSNR